MYKEPTLTHCLAARAWSQIRVASLCQRKCSRTGRSNEWTKNARCSPSPCRVAPLKDQFIKLQSKCNNFQLLQMNLYKSKVKGKHCSQTFDLPYFHQHQKLYNVEKLPCIYKPFSLQISCFKCRLTFHGPVMSWSDVCVNQGGLRGEGPIRGGEIVRRVEIPSAH